MQIHTRSTLTLFALYLAFGTLDNHFALGLSRNYTRRSGALCITGGSTQVVGVVSGVVSFSVASHLGRR
jgi:hypothetical protein